MGLLRLRDVPTLPISHLDGNEVLSASASCFDGPLRDHHKSIRVATSVELASAHLLTFHVELIMCSCTDALSDTQFASSKENADCWHSLHFLVIIAAG